MEVRSAEIPDIKIIQTRRFDDFRGTFSELYNRRDLETAGLVFDFVQENYSHSKQRGTLRGLHFQKPPAAQAKLLWVAHGTIVDVMVDCRRGSPYFGRHVMVELRAGTSEQLLCPSGFAHGFVTLEPDTEVVYRTTGYYAPSLEGGICWNDADLEIPWPFPADDLVICDRDRALPRFSELPAIFDYP